MTSIGIFTSITANYIPKARVLAESVKRFHPEIQFYLVLCDRPPQELGADEPFDAIITVEELPIPNRAAWIFQHAIVEMCTGVKGVACQVLFERYGCEKVLFFDPDIVVFSRLDSILAALDRHSVVLVPHQTVPETTRQAIIDNEICSLKHGVFNLGFLGLCDRGDGRRFLDWWAERCLGFCFNDIPGGLFTDQRWVDLAPAFFEDIGILRAPGYDVATWNLTHRVATGSLESGILVNGEPLCFYHFSGFDSGAQEVMLKKYGRHSPVLFELREWYLRECDRQGQSQLGRRPCCYGFFENGEPVTAEHRLLYRQREDLQRAYPNPFATADARTSHSYYHWFEHHGREEAIAKRYNYAEKGELALQQAQAEIEELNATIAGMESSKFWKLRQAWFKVKEWASNLREKGGQFLCDRGKDLCYFATQQKKRWKGTRLRLQGVLETWRGHQVPAATEWPIAIALESPSPGAIANNLVKLAGKIYSGGELKPNVVRLEVAIAQEKAIALSWETPEKSADLGGGFRCYYPFSATIDPFLLPAGKVPIEVRLLASSGEVIAARKTQIQVKLEGELANSVRHCLQQFPQAKLAWQGFIDSSDFPQSDRELLPWFDREDAREQMPKILAKYHLSSEYAKHFENFIELGYISLDEFIAPELIAQINRDIERAIADGTIAYAPESGDRIELLFQKSQAVRQLWMHPKILQILSALFDDRALPCQTLNFIHGSQQAVHQDTIHLTSFPEGYMCGVWVALEDISPDAGPLITYPKSHRLPILYARTIGLEKRSPSWTQNLIDEYVAKYMPKLNELLEKSQLQPMLYTPKAGSVLIWHANLAHGGTQRQDPHRSRYSMVSHYFASGAIAYYDTTGTIGIKHEIEEGEKREWQP